MVFSTPPGGGGVPLGPYDLIGKKVSPYDLIEKNSFLAPEARLNHKEMSLDSGLKWLKS